MYAKCKKCNDIVYSKEGHDMCYCKCGAIGIGNENYGKSKDVNAKCKCRVIFDYITGNKEDWEYLEPVYVRLQNSKMLGVNLTFRYPIGLYMVYVNNQWYCYDNFLSKRYQGDTIDKLLENYAIDFATIYKECYDTLTDDCDREKLYFKREVIGMVKYDASN